MKKRPTASRCYERGDQMKPRGIAWAATAGLVALMSAVLVAPPASAHSPATALVFKDGKLCVIGWGQIVANHTTGELSGVASTSFGVRSAQGCGRAQDAPDGQVATRYSLQRWNGSNWYNCRSTPFVYNSGPRQFPFEVIASNSHGAAPCGRGHYRTQAQTLAWTGFRLGGRHRGVAEPPPGSIDVGA